MDDDVADGCGNGGGLLPVDGSGVRLPCGPGRRTEGVDEEPGVGSEEGDEALADGSGGAEDAYFDGVHGGVEQRVEQNWATLNTSRLE